MRRNQERRGFDYSAIAEHTIYSGVDPFGLAGTREREQLRSLIEEILADGFVMQLATIDAQGPWVASLVYVHDRLDLYWVSTADSRHSKSLSADSRVAVNIVADSGTDKERALQIKGTAIRIEGPLFELEQRLQSKRGMPVPQTPGAILVDGYEWYKFVPAEFGIIYNTLFGYDRKNYTP